MKIVLVGGGTGGHFYPLIAVSEKVYSIVREKRMIVPEMYYIGPDKIDDGALYKNDIIYKYCPAGKMRRGDGIKGFVLNILDIIPISLGILKSLFLLFSIYPDVIFSKGGYASFPVLVASRILRIPVIIHESDSVPGRVTLWSAKFAKRIAVSYPKIHPLLNKYKDKIIITGVPVRSGLVRRAVDTSSIDKKKIGILDDLPLILVLTGSSGSVSINNVIINSLERLLKKYQVVHQVGTKNISDVEKLVSLTLEDTDEEIKDRYHCRGFLSSLDIKNYTSFASVIISRAGSGSIFEIANWGIPSIVIPIPENVSRDQKTNAYEYSRYGGGVVIEQVNLNANILISELNRIINDRKVYETMRIRAKSFATPDAAEDIAKEIIDILISHQ